MAKTAANYLQQLKSSLPRGLLWDGLISDDKIFNKLLTAFSQEFRRADVNSDALIDETDPRTIDTLLEDYEKSLSLPDNCINPPTDKAGRRAEVISRLVNIGGQSRQYFIDIASALGYTVTISEPVLHGWQTDTDIAIRTSRAGSPCGEPLRTYRSERTMECRYYTDKPAHSTLLFDHQNTTGENWVDKTSGTTEHLRSVDKNTVTGRWVVVGNNGVILISDDDGESWLPRASGTTNSLRTVKLWKGKWYIIGHGDGVNPATILTSEDDGETWQSVDIGGGESYLVSLSFSDDMLVAIGWTTSIGAQSLMVTTSDGINFNSNINVVAQFLYGIIWVEDIKAWGLVGNNFGSGYFGTSPNLVDWAEHDTKISSSEIWTVDYVDKNWIFSNGIGLVRTTSDRLNFKARDLREMVGENSWRTTHNPRGVTLMCGGFFVGKIMRSIDGGATWTQVYTNGAGALMSKAVYSGGKWVAVGWGGRITVSTS